MKGLSTCNHCGIHLLDHMKNESISSLSDQIVSVQSALEFVFAFPLPNQSGRKMSFHLCDDCADILGQLQSLYEYFLQKAAVDEVVFKLFYRVRDYAGQQSPEALARQQATRDLFDSAVTCPMSVDSGVLLTPTTSSEVFSPWSAEMNQPLDMDGDWSPAPSTIPATPPSVTDVESADDGMTLGSEFEVSMSPVTEEADNGQTVTSKEFPMSQVTKDADNGETVTSNEFSMSPVTHRDNGGTVTSKMSRVNQDPAEDHGQAVTSGLELPMAPMNKENPSSQMAESEYQLRIEFEPILPSEDESLASVPSINPMFCFIPDDMTMTDFFEAPPMPVSPIPSISTDESRASSPSPPSSPSTSKKSKDGVIRTIKKRAKYGVYSSTVDDRLRMIVKMVEPPPPPPPDKATVMKRLDPPPRSATVNRHLMRTRSMERGWKALEDEAQEAGLELKLTVFEETSKAEKEAENESESESEEIMDEIPMPDLENEVEIAELEEEDSAVEIESASFEHRSIPDLEIEEGASVSGEHYPQNATSKSEANVRMPDLLILEERDEPMVVTISEEVLPQAEEESGSLVNAVIPVNPQRTIPTVAENWTHSSSAKPEPIVEAPTPAESANFQLGQKFVNPLRTRITVLNDWTWTRPTLPKPEPIIQAPTPAGLAKFKPDPVVKVNPHLLHGERKQEKAQNYACDQCDGCPKVFQFQWTLRRHVQLKHDKSPSQSTCHRCGLDFFGFEPNVRYLHICITPEERVAESRPFRCEYCGKAYKLRNHFMKHMGGHELEMFGPTLRCGYEGCNAGYKLPIRLREHEKQHKKDMKEVYVCPLCPERFSAKRTMQKHKTAVHSVKRFECSACGKGYITKKGLQQHEAGKHGKSTYIDE